MATAYSVCAEQRGVASVRASWLSGHGFSRLIRGGSRVEHTVEVLDAVERFIAERPELELLSVRRRYFETED